MSRRDDELLEQLRNALRPEAQPPADRVAAIRRMVEVAGRVRLAEGHVRRGRRLRLVFAAFAVAVLALTFVGGAAFEERLPRSVRAAAHAIGLPVDSPELTEARALMFRLGKLVGRTERGDQTVASAAMLDSIERIDKRMLELVTKLDEEEKAKLVPVAHEVHLRAVQVLTESGRPPS